MNSENTTVSMYEIFEKRRHYPRLELHLPVTITGAGGKSFAGNIYDISPDGVQVRYAVRDGINLFPDNHQDVKNIKSLKCFLQFELPHGESAVGVVLEAYPIYLRAENDDVLSTGMYFGSSNETTETKKVNEFLFSKLEASYSELEYLKDRIAETEAKKSKSPPHTTDEPGAAVAGKKFPAELEELVATPHYASSELEQFKHLLIQVLSELKVIIELTRNTNEKIHQIEHKMTKESD